MAVETGVKPGLTLDIDQTLAEGVVAAHVDFYNGALDLGLTAAEIAATDSEFARTFDVPAIIEFRAGEGNEVRFQAARAQIRTSEAVHLALATIPFSVEQVEALTAEDGPFEHDGYYTVRPSEVEAATGQWLTAAGFPNAQELTICTDHQDKVRKILDDHIVEETPDGLVVVTEPRGITLVDDNLLPLVEACHELARVDDAYQEALGHFSIVGFGHDTRSQVYPDIDLHTYVLPSWERSHTNQLLTDMAVVAAASS